MSLHESHLPTLKRIEADLVGSIDGQIPLRIGYEALLSCEKVTLLLSVRESIKNIESAK